MPTRPGPEVAVGQGQRQRVKPESVDLSGTRIALCHEWFTTLGGSDRVAARIANVLDVDDVFAFATEPELVKVLLPDRDVHLAHPMGRYAQRTWRMFLPLMQHAWRSLDLDGYDLVITSSHAYVNAIRVPSTTRVISYCHTPMRYAWARKLEGARVPVVLRPFWPAIAAVLRYFDRHNAMHVDTFIANSAYVAERIEKCYGRSSTVIHPPIDLDYWTPDEKPKEEFFLLAGRLVGYKNFDAAVEAFSLSGLPLVVAGSGPRLAELKRKAGDNVTFEVQPSTDRLRDLYRRSRAFLHPGVEDFGMMAVEAQGCGTPVIALGEGGARETVIDGVTGVLYKDPTPSGLSRAVERFLALTLDSSEIVRRAARFDVSVFEASFLAVVGDALVGRTDEGP